MNTPYMPLKKTDKEEQLFVTPFNAFKDTIQGISQGEINILVPHLPFTRPPRYTLPMNFTTYYVLGDDKAFEDLFQQFQHDFRIQKKDDIKILIRSVLRKSPLTHSLYNK